MRVYLMRHAEAEDVAPSDAERRLTPRGEGQARAVAAMMARAGETPGLILTSPLVRTRETAEIVATELGARVREWPALAAGADPARVTAGLAEAARGAEAVMLVGHQPDLGALLAAMIGHPRALPFKKGAVARVDGSALAWFITPKLAGA